MKSLIIATMLMLSVNVGAQPSIDTLSVAAPTDTAQTNKENKLVIDLDFLTRGELRKGGLSNEEGADDQATFVIARTLLGIGYQRPGLIAHATAQHSGVWGSNETNSFNIYEAWVDLNTKNGFFAKVGRQSLSYDDQRIFGSDDWAMTAMSHDALKLGYEGHGHKLHVIGAFNQNIANIDGGTYFTGGLQPYKAMETVWYHYDVKKIPIGISLLFTNIGMQSDKEHKDTCTYQQQLFGTYIDYHTKKLTAEAAFYYQTGKEEHGIPVEVTADGRIFTPLGDGRIVYSRPSADSPFVMEISEIGDIQCLIDELIALEEEYNGNVQSYTYDRVVNQLPEGMSIESEEVTDDNTIVLTLTVD